MLKKNEIKKNVCKIHILFSKKSEVFDKKKYVLIQETLKSSVYICSYLLRIGQPQPKRVPQLRQCYKLHMPRVQQCHQ